ncbi:hypothetical protein ACHAXR_002386, partial [Thalassiosira sp. AJA248-18]
YINDVRFCYHSTVVSDKITFHRPDDDDPDSLLKLCITLMIASSLEVDNGVENLWKRGDSDGWKEHANFGQYIPKNYFKVFCAAFPFLWVKEDEQHLYWYKNPDDMPWELILGFMDEYNKKRNNLLSVVFLVLDEAMSGFRPKTSKTGGLPNLTHEPRKPVDLGTMLKDGAEGKTGIFAYHDIVQDLNNQRRKKYLVGDEDETRSHMPKGEDILQHVAECLRQCEGAGLEEGGWVGGDAWFGSINSSVELKKRLGVNSTFIIKHQQQYFPMEVLHEILLARYPKRPVGHWVVMTAKISGVDLYIMAYAWSNKGIAYIVSTCGTTVRHEKNYYASFEDAYGNRCTKELPRPAIAHMLYEFLPLIDEHNKARQSVLALEECWVTQSGWFRCLTTLIGMAVVDIQRWDRNKSSGEDGTKVHTTVVKEDDFDIKEMANLIAKPLRTGELKFRSAPQPSMRRSNNGDDDGGLLTRIRGEDGSITYKSKNGSKSEKKPRQRGCFICRRYSTTHVNTQWMCRTCGMPLCQVNRGRIETCQHEHIHSSHEILGCDPCRGRGKFDFLMPDELKVCGRTRAGATKTKSSNKRKQTPAPAATPSPTNVDTNGSR